MICHELILDLQSLIQIFMKKSRYIYLIITVVAIFVSAFILYKHYSDNKIEEQQRVDYQDFFNENDSVIYSNPQKGRLIYLEKQKEISSINDKVYLQISTRIALTYFLESEFEKSFKLIYESIDICEKNNYTEETAILYDYLATVFLQVSNYSEANNYYLKAQRIYSRINDNVRQAYVLNNMGVLYLELGNTEKALESVNQGIDIVNSTEDKRDLGILYTNKSLAFYKKNEFDSAQIYADLAIKIAVEKSSYYYLPKVYNIKGEIYLQQSDFKLARYYLSEGLRSAKNNDYKTIEINVLINFGKYFLKQQMVDSALFYSNIALENIILFDSNYKQLIKVNTVYKDIYKETGDIDKILFYTEELLSLNDLESKKNKAHEIYNLRLKQIAEQKLAADNKIESQNNLLKNKDLIIFIIVCCLLIVLLLYIYRQQKQHKEILLLTKRKNKAAIESELLERGRIGKELHDGLGQILTVIRLNLSLLSKNMHSSNSKEEEYLRNSINGVDDVFIEINSIIQNLSPTIITNKGLEKAVRKIVSEINKTKEISLKFEIFGFETKVDSLIENVLYRSIQELINNGIKHSKASEINIQLLKGDEEITLMVEDNGIGFDYSNYQNHKVDRHGLNNISTRVKNLNGQFYVDSQLERGSIITIIIPIN